MIPKGNLHAHGGRLATYITKGQDGEKAELIDMRGFAATDLREAFCDIQAIAESQTQCEKPFFHAYVRLPDDESLTREQWIETANRLEQKLGFDGQPRGVALHFLEDGTTHMHVAWSRIDTDQMKAIDPGLYLRKMKEVCRELEVEFGLRQVSSELPAERQTAAPKRPEFEQDRRLGVDGVEAREAIRSCYDRSDNGPSFAAALAEFDITLARGDRYAFVAVDSEGGLHGLGKRTLGVTLAEIETKLGAEFQRGLPTVDAVREQIRDRQERPAVTTEAAAPQVTQPQPTAWPSREELKASVTALWKESETGQAFVAGLGDLGATLARGDRRSFVLVDGRGDIHALPRMIDGARTAEVRAKLSDIDPETLPSVAEAKARTEHAVETREASRASYVTERTKERPETRLESFIAYQAATADNGQAFVSEIGSAGITLARATAADLAALQNEIEARPDGQDRYGHLKITEGELVAVNRFGGIHRLNPHHVDTDLCAALVEDCGRALPDGGALLSIQTARADALGVRAAQSDHWKDIQEEARAIWHEWANRPAHEIDNSKRDRSEPTAFFGVEKTAATVIGDVAKIAGQVADALGDLFAPQAPPTPEQIEENIAKAQREEEAAAPIREAVREMSEDEARRAAIAKAQAAMEEALKQGRDDRDEEYGHERTR